MKTFKVELLIDTDVWDQRDLIDLTWRIFTGREGVTLVENIVYVV